MHPKQGLQTFFTHIYTNQFATMHVNMFSDYQRHLFSMHNLVT